ncbi:MAG: glucose-6-phosphate isomerase [Pseudomonadota bacterium]
MTKTFIAAALVSVTALAGCQLTPQQQQAGATLGGLAAGLLVAGAFDANTELTILAAAAGAVAGQLLYQDSQSGDCAYADGSGGYRIAPCP